MFPYGDLAIAFVLQILVISVCSLVQAHVAHKAYGMGWDDIYEEYFGIWLLGMIGYLLVYLIIAILISLLEVSWLVISSIF